MTWAKQRITFWPARTEGNVDADLEHRVKALVANETGMCIERISLDTRIAQDIGCDGDDACELFEAFAKEFDVDLSRLTWNKHFSPEGFLHPLGCLVALFGWSCSSAIGSVAGGDIPVTVGDLVDAAKAKKWVKSYRTKVPPPI